MPYGTLGRHVEHDPASRLHPFTLHPDDDAPIRSVTWHRRAPIWSQGPIGACTCFAGAGVLMTGDNADKLAAMGVVLTPNDALELYKSATRLDNIPGHWPPTDTGSSGLGAAKAMRARGLIKRYKHCFSTASMQRALMRKPVMVGWNWYDSFNKPRGLNAVCEISPDAAVEGGHEVGVIAWDDDAKEFVLANSWGDSWGWKGYFRVTYETADRLMHEKGDCTVPEVE
jgi:hypothetical protein